MEPSDLGVDPSLYVHLAGAAIGAYVAVALPLVIALIALSIAWPWVKAMLLTWVKHVALEIAIARAKRKAGLDE